jgi:hypothetical protein
MPKTRSTFQIDDELLDKIRDAVVYSQKNSWYPRTLSEFVDKALRSELAKVTKTNAPKRGFPKRKAQLRPGRRIE